MITLYKSTPQSGNVGDILIGESAEKILDRELNEDIITYFDDGDLSNELDVVKSSKCLFVAGFGLGKKIWRPVIAEILRDEEIDTPIIPLGSAWGGGFPGDYEEIIGIDNTNFTPNALDFYNQISNQNIDISVRDYYTQKVFGNIDINSHMVGDCAWYHFDSFGEEMHSPSTIGKIVVTDPHRVAHYHDQMLLLLNMLTEMFEDAERYFCFHSQQHHRREAVKPRIKKAGFKIRDHSDNTENLSFYDDCDLHVGYRLHGHVAFLSKRIPSILLYENGRGLGQIKTFGGTGGFSPIHRRLTSLKFLNPLYEKARPIPYIGRTLPHPTVPAKKVALIEEIKDFITQEIESDWRRYQNIPHIIESTYEEEMKPFVSQVKEL